MVTSTGSRRMNKSSYYFLIIGLSERVWYSLWGIGEGELRKRDIDKIRSHGIHEIFFAF